MCSSRGSVVPKARNIDLEAYRFIEEQVDDRKTKIVLQYDDGSFEVHQRELREMEDLQSIYFEKNWAGYLTDGIYREGFEHP